MAYAREDECERVGVDAQKVERIANRIEKAAKELSGMGLHIFGGSGSGSIRFNTIETQGEESASIVVAEMSGLNFDGGDGATALDSNGLLRGEY